MTTAYDETPSPSVPAAPGSALVGLRERLTEARDELHLRLRVPRVDPPVYVRYGPVSADRMAKARSQAAQGGDAAVVVANAAMLADACQAIFEVVDDRESSLDPEGELLTFSPRLAELLGVQAAEDETIKAGDLVRRLYLTDGDISSAADRLVDWSGWANFHEELNLAGN